MTARPTARELLEAAREHLEQRVLPTISDPQLKFQTLVAAHVLGVVERELALGDAPAWHAWEDLGALLGVTEPRPAGDAALQHGLAARRAALCAAIREGRFDADAGALEAYLVRDVETALAAWNPAFLARVSPSPR